MCWFPSPMEGDDDTTLIIAGDLWEERRFLTQRYPPAPGFVTGPCWMELLARRFKYVVFVLGNHDYWGTNLLYEPTKTREALVILGMPNVFFLERSTVVLDQVKFTGGTLWTDYNRHDPMILHDATFCMASDHHYIKFGPSYSHVKAMQLYEIHENTKRYIFQNAKRDEPGQKVVVVTHMAPSGRSVSPLHKNEYKSNFYYYSSMEKRILAEGGDIDFWMHGHMHCHNNYPIGNVRVLSNARGYRGYESEEALGFQPQFRIEL